MFWHLNPKKLEPFRKKYELMLENQNNQAWLNGLYVVKAISNCFANAEYPAQPIDFNETSNDSESDTLTDAELFEMYAIKMNKEKNLSE